MKLVIFTLVLDGMPFIRWHLPILDQLQIDWQWIIVEGAAMPGGSTKWCQTQTPRLSRDGTAEYLTSLSNHPRVTIIRKQLWQSKDEMCNAALSTITKPCFLLQMDCDEVWTSRQLESLYLMFGFSKTEQNCAYFYCRYYVGPNIIITSKETYGNKAGEWLRAWKFKPGMKFKAHEPPIIENLKGYPWLQKETEQVGLVFQHFAYCFPEQVAYKEKFYGYPNALANWQRLQANTQWPVKLRDFLPWVKDDAVADLLWKP